MSSTTLQNLVYRTRAASFATKLALALSCAALTGLMAQLRIPLPFTPVPVTGQTYAVLMSGVLLGTYWGGISQLIYVLLGVAGLPWFSGASSGAAVLAGPTAGYLVGFVLASFFVGWATDRFPATKKFSGAYTLMTVASLSFIFVPGLIQLALWTHAVQGDVSFAQILTQGFTPFIPGEVIKTLLAAASTKLLLKR